MLPCFHTLCIALLHTKYIGRIAPYSESYNYLDITGEDTILASGDSAL